MADVSIDLAVDAGNASSVIQGLGSQLGSLAGIADDAAGGLADTGVSVDDLTNFMDIGQRRADDLARAQNAVEQASLDMEQATRDAAQAQLDINQAQRDGVQAGIDLEQAQLDQKVATEELAEAEREFGKGSLEAQQAALDLKQADEDVRQAKEDAKQATEDLAQAQLDAKQGVLDGKEAQLDLNEAQRGVVGPAIMNSWVGTAVTLVSSLSGLVGAFALLNAGMLTTAATSAATALSVVGNWIRMAAVATVNAIRMAAAWLISLGPIGIVIAVVVALVALIIANWDTVKAWTIKIFKAVWRFLVNLWNDIVSLVGKAIDGVKFIFFNFVPLGIIIKNWGAITGWIRKQWDNIKRLISSAVRKIGSFFNGMWNGITSGLRGALNGAISLINSAISGINTLISGANKVPGVSIPFIPFIPFLAEGGITTGPTLAMIGEGREQEAVLPLSKLQGLMKMDRGQDMTVRFENGSSDEFMAWLQSRIRLDFDGDVNNLNPAV